MFQLNIYRFLCLILIVANATETSRVCVGSKINLRCNKGWIISVKRVTALYVLPACNFLSRDIPRNPILKCSKSIPIKESLHRQALSDCDGQQNCTVEVSSSIGSCLDLLKRLLNANVGQVEYACTKGKTVVGIIYNRD